MRAVGRLLVVDPSLLDRQRIAAILEAVGYEVIVSDNPDDALEQLAGASPGSIRAVVTEMHFPKGDVADLIRRMRSDPAWVHTPLLVLTPQPPLTRVVELARAGVTTIISKPFSAVVLLRRLTECLEECTRATAGGQRVSWDLTEYIGRELKRADRSRSPLTLVVLRLAPGTDETEIPRLIQTMARNLRESDLVVRIGSREVALVLPDADTEAAEAVVRRMEAILDRPVCAGTAVYPNEAADADLLLHLARERVGMTISLA